MAFATYVPSIWAIFELFTRLSSFIMVGRTIIDQQVSQKNQTRFINFVKDFLPINRKKTTIIIDETDARMAHNEIYDAAEVYLCSKLTQNNMERFKISKNSKDPKVTVKFDTFQDMTDVFEGVELEWRYVFDETKKKYFYGTTDDDRKINGDCEKKYLELTFNKEHRKHIMDKYVPFVLQKANSLKTKNKVIKLHTLRSNTSYKRSKTKWDWINLEHPSTFETLAMEAEKKKAIKDDLDRFVSRKDFFRKVGRAWKRGYLLYGPPGTGKSSLIAAMANYLKFDIYDLELTNVEKDSDLRKLLLSTANSSILVIEDIDCSVPLPDRKKPVKSSKYKSKNHMQLFSLSGLLNFVDGLWSSCGDERIIIFTTNHKERLDPALLRPGRMDMHIHMSYLTIEGFKLLASTYLNVIDSHPLYPEIEELLDGMRVTPAEVAEEFMRADDADVCLDRLVTSLKCKKDCESTKIVEDEVISDDDSTEDEDCDSYEDYE